MQVKILPGVCQRNVFGGRGGAQMIFMGINLPKDKPGIIGVVVTPEFNIAAEIAQIPGVGVQDILNTEPNLRALSLATKKKPFNIFLVNGGKGGAGHNAIVWPFSNRHKGEVVGTPGNEKVKVKWGDQEILIPANWPPPNSGWKAEPSRAIHGFGYRKPNTIIKGEWDGKESCFLEGETNVSADEWFTILLVTHRISLEKGVLKRTVSVKNLGKVPVPFACGEHPDFAIPEGQSREGVLLGIPARLLVKVTNMKDLLPDFGNYPFIPVNQLKPFGRLFRARNDEGLFPIGNTFIDTCFTGLDENPVVRVLFPEVKWGISVKGSTVSSPDMINALQIYAPPPGGPKLVAVELQGNVPDPFNPAWDSYGEIKQCKEWLTGSGMHIIKPDGHFRTWHVSHRIEMRP